MLATVVVLIALIQAVQYAGDAAARHFQRTSAAAKRPAKRRHMWFVATGVAALAVVAIGYHAFATHRVATADRPLRVGVNPVPHGEILQAALPLLSNREPTYRSFTLRITCSRTLHLSPGDLDANYFQHVPFMENFNRAKNAHVVSVGKVHIEPLGIYAGRSKSLSTLPDKAVITIPNDPANSGRALLLLQAAGLLHLRTENAVGATVEDVSENPKHLQVRLLEAAQLPRSLQDADITVINMNYALAAKLNPLKDALVLEGSASPYANIVSTCRSVRKTHVSSPWLRSCSRLKCRSLFARSIKAPYSQQVNKTGP